MFLDFKSVRNIRDLGGISLKEGKIKQGLLLRGGSLFTLNKEEYDILFKQFNVKTIIDFRSVNSFYTKPDKYPEGINYKHYFVLDFLDNVLYKLDMKISPRDFFFEIYKGFALDSKAINAFSSFLKDVINTKEGAIYIHCTSGKDRTGIAVTLLLLILGASKETIYNEYLLSNEYTQNELDRFIRANPNLDQFEMEFYDRFYLVKKEYLDIYFESIISEYKSIPNYLEKALKITPIDQNLIRKRYIDK